MSDEDYEQGFSEGYDQGLSTDKEKSFLILAARIDELKKENACLRVENESLKKENWEHIARGYALISMLPDETLVGDIQTARRNIGGVVDSLRAENERLREALSYYAEEDYNGYNGNGACARAALEGVTKKSGAGNE